MALVTTTDPIGDFAIALMQLAEQVKPMHEFLAGQRAYFLSLGHTPEEALALSASVFVALFGAHIPRDLPEGWSG